MKAGGASRAYLMCPPEYFDVVYEINPWMDRTVPVDRGRAVRQWQSLVDVYRGLGHTVELLEAVAGLPDMVFTANGSVVIDSVVVTAQFAAQQRRAEAAHHRAWHLAHAAECGWSQVVDPTFVNEGEGDFALAGDAVLAGYGFRTDVRAHAELAEAVGRPVISLRLCDPRFYHLDVALTVLGSGPDGVDIAWYPAAFTASSQAIVRRLFPRAIEVSEADALVLGVNAVSDGVHVVLAQEAVGFADSLRAAGFVPVPVELDELRKGGGSVKCCTQELRLTDEARARRLGQAA